MNTLLEYGDAYLEVDARIVEAMHARMTPETVALAQQMAEGAIEQDEIDDA